MSTVLVELRPVTCGKCGIVFGMEENYYQKRLEDHAVWYCPSGHTRCFGGETEAERERRRREHAEARHAREQELRIRTERRLIAQRAATTRLKRRVAAGVCPCCNRTFQSLARHMQQRHPDFVASAKPERGA